ncbi:hypothetical protein [Achromobacter xylosoxidans]|uniref:hypothetical protein n=1 Tax=Alcaligenes xylosoxydans xylosoxydans TaxID=85698 RepID=UPI0013AEF2E6|nr:hypothetical protein [Achromobacter xylosoxidans]
MKRLYAAARAAGRLSGKADQADLARLLNAAPQTVPSKEALLSCQAAFGANATWVLTGTGPMFVSGGLSPAQSIDWPFSRLDLQRLRQLGPQNLAYVEGRLEALVERIEADCQRS